MRIEGLDVSPGRWVVANCGKYPSEKHCRLVLMAPEDQRQDLIEAAVQHAVVSHGHTDTPEFRDELVQGLDTLEIEEELELTQTPA